MVTAEGKHLEFWQWFAEDLQERALGQPRVVNHNLLGLLQLLLQRAPLFFDPFLPIKPQLQSLRPYNSQQGHNKQNPLHSDHEMILQGIILFCRPCKFKCLQQFEKMTDFLEDIRTHFNILIEGENLSLTMINPNLTAQVMHCISDNLTLISHLESIELVVIECPSFDDQLLTIFAKGLPRSLTKLTLDLTGCESIRGDGFLQLFEKLDGLELTKLSLDLGSLYDINDIVVEGLTLLLSNLTNSLQQFYLDLYQVDQITGDGYLLLTEAITDLEQLNSLYLDFSANYNLTQDSLEILFATDLSKLKHFTFKILDSDQIGGGSFFKLAETMGKMQDLEELCLTISTFDHLNHKGIYSVLRAISKMQKLKKLHLNLSNIDLPEKVLSYLAIAPNLSDFSLDISCNRRISFGDLVNIGNKIKAVRRIQLNLDFCSAISEDVIEEIVAMICRANKCFFLSLTDRNYTPQLQNSLIPLLMGLQTLVDFRISGKQVSKRLFVFQEYLRARKLMLWSAFSCKARDLPYVVTRAIMDRLFYCH